MTQTPSEDSLKARIAAHKRSAWKPIVKGHSSDGRASKFSGLPVLRRDETWPCCKHCGEPMQLFLQLDSNDLPEAAGTPFGNGILQVFYCTNDEQECETECEAFFPFADSTLVRVLNPLTEELVAAADNPVKAAFAEKSISGWEESEDYPNPEELEELGCELNDKQTEALFDLEYPKDGDKLLGWPHWVQGVEYPACPDCGEPMSLIFQIDSENNLPYMFGDTGIAHVTQCKQHPERLTIAWACY